MAGDLNLSTGERGKSTRSSGSASTRSTRVNSDKENPPITDNDLKGKLQDVFTDIADWREKRDDSELAEAIRESHEDMAKGLVALTRTVKWFRGPLAFAVNFVKPVLAFGKVGRILAERFIRFRATKQESPEPENPYVQQP